MKGIERYDQDQQRLAELTQEEINSLIHDVGLVLRPAIVQPGEDIDSVESRLSRGGKAVTFWANHLRKVVLDGARQLKIASPPTYTLICGLVLGEIAGIVEAVGDEIPEDLEERMADVFEGAYILGRLKMEQAIERGLVTLEHDQDGVVRVLFAGKVIH